jgi:hypothetical protein
VIVAGGCKINEFEGNVLPADPGIETKVYPLPFPFKEGFRGELTFSKIGDGSTLVKFQISGTKSGNRYFAKLSVSNAADFANNADLADLGEISGETGTGSYWLKKNYKNHPLLFDSLLIMDAKVRIIEIDQADLSPKEVLRGDIGSNALLEGSRSFLFSEIDSSGISGRVEIKQRQNGKFILNAIVSGIPQGKSLPVYFFRGNFETGEFSRIGYLGNYSSGQESAYYGYDAWAGGLVSLDTLAGFLGIESINELGDTLLVAASNFGGNKASGKKKSYGIYSEADSALIGNLTFEELGKNLKMTFEPIQIPQNESFLLTFNKSNSLSAPDSFFTLAIHPTKKRTVQNPRKSSDQVLKFDDLESWDAHAIVAKEGFSSILGKADLGINEIIKTDSLVKTLSEINPNSQGYSGTIVFRPNKRGKILAFYRLNNSIPFAENNLIIRNGPKPSSFEISDTTATAMQIGSFLGGTAGVEVRGKSIVWLPGNVWADWSLLLILKSQDAYLEYNFSDSGYIQEIFSRGPLGQ